MTDRPIIFSGPMVQALLAGRKTQTRRKTRLQPFIELRRLCETIAMTSVRIRPGDRLWVREAYAIEPDGRGHIRVIYSAGGPDTFLQFSETDPRTAHAERLWTEPEHNRPSIHMPRWASRLTLTVTDVRVQRLQDISEEDAVAEGAMLNVTCKSSVSGTTVACDSWFFAEDSDGRHFEAPSPAGAYEILWGKLHGWKSWDANPWVAAITFSVEHRNIDAVAP